MPNLYDDIRRIVREHEELDHAVVSNARSLGELLRRNLKHLSQSQLNDIKMQLRKYNMHTGKWSKK